MPTTYAIPDGRTVMNTVLRTATGSSGSTVTSLLFQPDLIWDKPRSNSGDHVLMDSVRGTASQLHTNTTGSQDTSSQFITAFNSNGYTIGTSDWTTGWTLVDWCWKAGGTAVSNTSGTITSQVSANTTAGFSVVTYTGTGSTATVGHGLGVAPSMVIVKNRTSAGESWCVYHVSVGAANRLFLNTTGAQVNDPTGFMNSTAPTSTVFTVGSNSSMNGSGTNLVAYCFAAVAGYSAFGSYTGNGSTDGPFVYTGFRPRFILFKRTDTTADWRIEDTSRSPTNATQIEIYPNLSNAEGSAPDGMDILSNGFKLRGTYSQWNASGGTFIYAAFAENPFKYANAR